MTESGTPPSVATPVFLLLLPLPSFVGLEEGAENLES